MVAVMKQPSIGLVSLVVRDYDEALTAEAPGTGGFRVGAGGVA